MVEFKNERAEINGDKLGRRTRVSNQVTSEIATRGSGIGADLSDPVTSAELDRECPLLRLAGCPVSCCFLGYDSTSSAYQIACTEVRSREPISSDKLIQFR